MFILCLIDICTDDRAKLDNSARLLDFTEKLEEACIRAVESGKMTKDLALIIHGPKYVHLGIVPLPLEFFSTHPLNILAFMI